MPILLDLFCLFVGLAIGSVAAWLVAKSHMALAYQKGRNESQAETVNLSARLCEREQNVEDLKHRLNQAAADLKCAQDEVTSLKEELARFRATLEQEREHAQEKLAVVNDAQRKLSDAFKALAAESLRNNNESFLELANATLGKFQEAAKGDLEKRQQAIVETMTPVTESLKAVDEKIQDLEKAREGAYQGMTQQVKSLLETQKELRTETSKLVKALRTPSVRGRWGEIQLRRVVELAGMVNRCDFFEQQSAEGADGKLRPDMLVRLPGRRNIVVDSKVPLTAFLESLDATDEDDRRMKLSAHARHVRTHVEALGRKSYFEQFDPTPEFVVLFMPGEVFFSAALEQDPDLIEVGVEQKVVIATPTTLIALLRAVAYGWNQEEIAHSAKEISELGRELHKRLSQMGGHLAKLGKGLEGATEAYNRAVGSLESRVFVTARKFTDLSVSVAGVEIEQLVPIETIPRRLQAPELAIGQDAGKCEASVGN